jgi:glycine cleavage system transcriptional repressor
MSSVRSYKALTAIGSDRPGLVNAISALVQRHGANIEDSRMAILGGEFAMIVLCSGSASELTAVEQAAQGAAAELGLHFVFKDTETARPRDYRPYLLRVSGIDRPGIVGSVTAPLAERGVNLASLESKVVHLPMSGTPTFVLEAELQIPPSTSLSELRRVLGELSEADNLDISIEPSAGTPA